MDNPGALRHAESLAYATAELARYAREGASTPSFPFGLDDIVDSLAEALAFTLQVELAAEGAEPEQVEAGRQLLAALSKWASDAGGTAWDELPR